MTDRQSIISEIRKRAREYGMTRLARDSGVKRETLYQMLGNKGNPTLRSLMPVLGVLGLRLTIRRIGVKIGDEFETETGKWRVTDIGTRTVVAIKLDHPEDESWYNGPPYAVAEYVFDEGDIEAIVKWN